MSSAHKKGLVECSIKIFANKLDTDNLLSYFNACLVLQNIVVLGLIHM